MDFRQIKQMLRIIFRNKTFSVLNISGLAIGITCAALILLWVEYQVNDNRSVPKIKQLYEIGQNQRYGDETRTFFVSPGPLSEMLNNGFKVRFFDEVMQRLYEKEIALGLLMKCIKIFGYMNNCITE